MASKDFRWALLASTAVFTLAGTPALAQSGATRPAPQLDCKATPTDPACPPAKAADGSTYLTPLVVSGAAGGVGDPYGTPAPVSTVGSEEINQFGGQNLDNVLRTQPGTFTRDNAQNPGVAVNIRGFEGSGRVNMQIDGARQTFRFTGHEAQGFTYVDPAMLGGIDVTRGAVAGAGGAGALAGTVNFRTLEVGDLLHDGKTFGGFTSVTAGTNGTGVSEAAAAAFRVNDTFAVLGAISKRNPSDFVNGDGQLVQFTAQDILSGLVKAEITPTLDSKLTVSALVYNNDFTANSYDQTVNNQTYTAHYDFTPADNALVDLHAGVFVNRTRMEYGKANPVQPYAGPPLTSSGRVIDDQGWGFSLYNTSRGQLGELGVKATYGAEYAADDVSAVNSTAVPGYGVNPSGKSSIGGVFASTTLSRGIVDLTGGLRYDHFTADGSGGIVAANPFGMPAGPYTVARSEGRLDPSVTLALNPTDWLQPYISYAESFRPPTVSELLTGGNHPGVGGMFFLPNPFLHPELSRTWEVGSNFRRDDVLTPGDSLRLKANYFHSQIDDYITAQFTPMGAAYFGNNPGASTVQGIELQAAYDSGAYFASLAYTHTNTDLPPQVDGFGATSYVPDDVFTATIGARLLEQQNLTVGARLNAVGPSNLGAINVAPGAPTTLPGYQIVDLFANYKFDNGLELGGNIGNVFDVTYTPALSTTATSNGVASGRGRSFEFTAKASF